MDGSGMTVSSSFRSFSMCLGCLASSRKVNVREVAVVSLRVLEMS